jgi:hypothetical protein
MNQIPNIEETHDTETEEVNAKIYEYVHHFEEREVSELPLGGLYKIVEVALTAQKQAHHQQLQKARQDGYNAGLADGIEEECNCTNFSKDIVDTSECKLHQGNPNTRGVEEMITFVEVDGVGVALFQSDTGLKLTVSGSKEFIKEIPLHQQLQKAREKEAYLWFNTWFSRTIKPGNQDFGKWASERLQTLGVNHSELDQDVNK